MSAEPQLLHPVLELLGRRASSSSRPGRRSDGARIALVIEGSGAPSVVSSAMAAALEQAGLTASFDLVVGSSGGAVVGAAFVANVAGAYADALCGTSTRSRVLSPIKRLVERRALDAVLDGVHVQPGVECHPRALASPIELHCIATDVATADSADLTDLRTVQELRGALLAATRAPSLVSQPVELRGRRYLDGALAEAIPLRSALAAGATHCLVLITGAHGARSPAPRRFLDRLLERKLRRLNPRLVDRRHWRDEHGAGYVEHAAVVARSQRRRRRPYVFAVTPPSDIPVVHEDERRASVLQAAADASLLETLHTVVEAVRLRRAFVPAPLEEHDRAAE